LSTLTTDKGTWRIYSNPDPHRSPINRLYGSQGDVEVLAGIISGSHSKDMNMMLNAVYKEKKLDPRCDIKKHIIVFTYLLYRFIINVYNDVHHFSNILACFAK
jgi:hypothetical protein